MKQLGEGTEALGGKKIIRLFDDEFLRPFRLDRLRRWSTLAILGWVVMLVVISLIFLFSPERATGFLHYLRGGYRWLEGLPIYSLTPNKGFVYSPLIAAFFSLSTLVPVYLANILWRWGAAAVLLAGLWSSFRYGPFTHIPRHLRGMVYLLMLPLAAGNLDSGQANPIVIGLVMIALAAACARHWTVAALAAAGAFYWKIYPLALGLLLVLAAPRKILWRLVFALAVMALLPFLFQKPSYVAEQYHQWVVTRLADNRLEYRIEIAPLDFWFLLVRLGHVPLGVSSYNFLRVAGGAAIAWFCLYGRWRGWSGERVFGGMFCLVCVWMMLLGPASESLSYLILAPAAAIAVVESFATRTGADMRVLAILGYGFMLLAVLHVGFFPHSGGQWVLAFQPVGAIFFLGYCLRRYLDDRLWPDEAKAGKTCDVFRSHAI